MDQRERTLQCLANPLATQESEFAVVLWDNGSHDGTAEAVRESFPQVLVHPSPANLGVASGRNAAAEFVIQTFYPTHLLFLDNDMLVEPGFVTAHLEPFTEDEV